MNGIYVYQSLPEGKQTDLLSELPDHQPSSFPSQHLPRQLPPSGLAEGLAQRHAVAELAAMRGLLRQAGSRELLRGSTEKKSSFISPKFYRMGPPR